MSKLRFTVASVAIALLCGFSTAQAQQIAPTEPSEIPRAADRPSQVETQPDGSQNDQSDRYEARRVSTDPHQQGPTVKEALVQKLQKANEAEIELAKLAIQKSDNQDVKQLAQMIVQDHQACNQKLQKMTEHRRADQQRPESREQLRGENPQADRQPETRTLTASHSATVPPQLCQIADQACDNALKMTKDMLNRYEGQDFNMAFLGQQCVAHTMMLAELQAIESNGPQELQPVVQEASQKVEQHLQKCKQLAKQLEDDRNRDRS